jgi:hypothetical protein
LLAGKEASAVASAHKADATAAPDSRDECGGGGGHDGRFGGHQHPASHQKLQPDVHCDQKLSRNKKLWLECGLTALTFFFFFFLVEKNYTF